MTRSQKNSPPPPPRPLKDFERRYYRDQLRTARYAALADAEAFNEICFALEELGLRLLRSEGSIWNYKKRISEYALESPTFNCLSEKWPAEFKSFEALYEIVRAARNDSMHLGAYARHATEAAIELCIGLEEGLMMGIDKTVGNVMIKAPITIEPWQPVAHARQLMLMHSFSFLPVRLRKKWWMVSELGLAKYLTGDGDTKALKLGKTIAEAWKDLGLVEIPVERLLYPKDKTKDVLSKTKSKNGPMLWLVVEENRLDHLAGVLSPFELM